MSRLMVNIFFDQTINNDIKAYENIRKIAISQGDDYTTGLQLDYTNDFARNCKRIVNVS